MKLTLNFDDLSEDEVQTIIDKYIKTRIYFSERQSLIKQGETTIKLRIQKIIENVKKSRSYNKSESLDSLLLDSILDALKKLANE